jgi:hypothetical protein
LNTVPNGEVAAEIAKIKIAKIIFGVEKHDFRRNPIGRPKIPYTLLRKSDSMKNFYPSFTGISATNQFSIFFCNNSNF